MVEPKCLRCGNDIFEDRTDCLKCWESEIRREERERAAGICESIEEGLDHGSCASGPLDDAATKIREGDDKRQQARLREKGAPVPFPFLLTP